MIIILLHIVRSRAGGGLTRREAELHTLIMRPHNRLRERRRARRVEQKRRIVWAIRPRLQRDEVILVSRVFGVHVLVRQHH